VVKKSIYSEIISGYGITVVLADGGDTRQQSVFNGLEKVSGDVDYIAIHDGARPLVKSEDIENTLRNAEKYGASALAVPVKDTIKKTENGKIITETVNRENLFAMQTPQIFKKSLYLEALENIDDEVFTDDCCIIENFGKKVVITQGNYTNIKITTPEDLAVARVFYEL